MNSFGVQHALNPELGAILVDSASGPGFAPMLLEVARHFEPVEEIFAYRTSREGRPQALISSSGLADSAERARLYAHRFHLNDPAFRNAGVAQDEGGFCRRVQSSEIEPADYRAVCFERPSFVDKTCFGWRDKDRSIVLSFYRRAGGHENPEVRLSSLAAIALTALVRRTKLADARPSLETRLQTRLTRSYPQLPVRELQVCTLTLAGWTSTAISRALGLRPSTVLTYRQRAYRRLGCSQANELLDGIID